MSPFVNGTVALVKQRLTDGIMLLHLCTSAGPFNCEPNEISAHANRVRAAVQCFIHDSIRIFPPSICRLRAPANSQTRRRDPVPPKKPVIRVGGQNQGFSYLNTEQMSRRPTFESSCLKRTTQNKQTSGSCFSMKQTPHGNDADVKAFLLISEAAPPMQIRKIHRTRSRFVWALALLPL